MRTGSRILLIIAVAIVVFGVLVITTPLGWRVGTPLASRVLRQRTGLELSVGSVGGSPLSRLVLSDISLHDPDSGPLFSAASLTVHYDFSSLRRGAPVIHELTVDGAVLTLDTGGDGALVGWGRLASGDTTAVVSDGELVVWTLVEAHLTDVTVRYRNDAIGTVVDALFSEVEASGDQDELDVRLAVEGTVSHPTLTDTVHARLSAAGRLLADVVELESLALAARGDMAAGNALTMNSSGVLAISPEAELRLILDGWIDGGAVLPLVAAASAAPAASGLLDVSGSLEGSWTDLEWTAVVTSESITLTDISVAEVALHASGAADTITVDHLALRALGGDAEVRGSVALAGAVPSIRGSGRVRGIDVAAIQGSPLHGKVDLSFSGSMTLDDLSSLDAVIDVDGRGLRVDPGGKAMATDVGDARIHAAARNGRLAGSLAARGAAVEFDGVLTETGIESVTATAVVEDIAASLAGLTDADVAGGLKATFESERPMDGFAFTARAEVESLRVGSVTIGTASVTAEGDPADMAGRFSMFDGDASGTWALAGGGFEVDAMLDSLAVGGEFAVSPTRSVEIDGSTTGRVAFATAPDGGFDLVAELEALSLASGGENIHLTAPVVIEASRDSVRIRGLEFAGTLGVASVDGVFSPLGGTHVSAAIDSLKLDSVLAVVGPDPEGADIRGVVRGSGELRMRDGSLSLNATLAADGLVANGVRIGDIAIDAESDDADLIFALTSRSDAGGRITALGSLPYASDTTGVFSIETDRDFAVSVVCSSYVFEGGPGFLPRIRGRKQFTLNGSALVTGRADSLGSVNGVGLFDRAGAAWGFVSFALADTFGFSVTDGAIEIDGLSMEVMRQRALGPELGGRVDVAGRIEHDGRLALTATTTNLDVAHVSRAITPGATPPVTGMLTADAAIGGTLSSPRVTFSWSLAEPGLGGVRFDDFRGSGTADPYVLELTLAELTLGKNVMTASGVIPLKRAQGPALYPGMYAGVSEMDVTVRADGFRLNRARGLPKGMKQLAGIIDADIHMRGAPEAPDIEGVVTVREGRIEFDKLEQPIRDIEIRVVGSGGTATVERASARVGSGTASATGTMQTSMSGAGGFSVNAEFTGVDLTVKNIVAARASGRLRWNGTAASSLLKGRVTVDEAEVTYKAGVAELFARRPRAVIIPQATGPRSHVALDIAADIIEPVRVRSNLAETELTGGVRAGGTLAEPSLSGGVSADGGSVSYLGQEFLIDSFSVLYTDPRKRVPFVDFAGTADVESSAGDAYVVTIRYQGFAGEAVPELTSVPPLSEPDIAALLTFGDTMGALTSGGASGSASESFGSLARSAFVGGLFGVAETTARRWLNLDTVDVSGESLDTGALSDAQVTFGKRFGRRLGVDYTTDLGGFSGQTVGLSWRLTDEISIETKANQEGNHAIGIKFRFRLE